LLARLGNTPGTKGIETIRGYGAMATDDVAQRFGQETENLRGNPQMLELVATAFILWATGELPSEIVGDVLEDLKAAHRRFQSSDEADADWREQEKIQLLFAGSVRIDEEFRRREKEFVREKVEWWKICAKAKDRSYLNSYSEQKPTFGVKPTS
jgi:hypothetical protein